MHPLYTGKAEHVNLSHTLYDSQLERRVTVTNCLNFSEIGEGDWQLSAVGKTVLRHHLLLKRMTAVWKSGCRLPALCRRLIHDSALSRCMPNEVHLE